MADKGRGKDHRAAAIFEHLCDLVFGAEKGASQIDCQGVAPAGFGHFRGRAAFTERAGIIESDVESAIAFDGQRDQGFGIVLRANIASQCHGLTTRRADLHNQLIELFYTACPDYDFGAFGGE